MTHRSPTTPVAGVRPSARDLGAFARGELSRITSHADRTGPSSLLRGDRSAAVALSISTIVLVTDLVVRPLLTPGMPSHPVLQWGAVGAMTATAFGLGRGWRLARRLARGIGYVYGLGSLFSLANFVSAGATANWWEAGVWAITAASLGIMLTRLGWLGDDE